MQINYSIKVKVKVLENYEATGYKACGITIVSIYYSLGRYLSVLIYCQCKTRACNLKKLNIMCVIIQAKNIKPNGFNCILKCFVFKLAPCSRVMNSVHSPEMSFCRELLTAQNILPSPYLHRCELAH